MDTFDHIPFDDTPEENLNQQEEPVAQEPDSGAYHNHGTGRKESPYADSPYEMHHAPRQEYHYRPQTQPPVKPKKEKKPGVAPNRGPAQLRHVDTRTSNINIDKYNEKYESIAPANSMKDNYSRKQKIKQKLIYES